MLSFLRFWALPFLILIEVAVLPAQTIPTTITAYAGSYFEIFLTAHGLPPGTYHYIAIGKLPEGLDTESTAYGLHIYGTPKAVEKPQASGAGTLDQTISVFAVDATVMKTFDVALKINPNTAFHTQPSADVKIPVPGYAGKVFRAQIEIDDNGPNQACLLDADSPDPQLAKANLKLTDKGELTSKKLSISSVNIMFEVKCKGQPGAAKFTIDLGPNSLSVAAVDVTSASVQAKVHDAIANPNTLDDDAPATTSHLFYNLVGGFEQVALSSSPSKTEPFVRLYVTSGPIYHPFKKSLAAWGSIRLLGAPTQEDTKGVVSVFTDPSGAITDSTLASVGTAVDFTVGASYRLTNWGKLSPNSVDVILGFGATSPLPANKVEQSFVIPAFGTSECNTLYSRFATDFAALNVAPTTDGAAANQATGICLVNLNTATGKKSNGDPDPATSAPVTTLAFTNQDRTSFFLKDMIGVRFNHTAKADNSSSCADTSCYLGTVDFTFGNDAAITGGAFTGDRWVFRGDGVYPIIAKENLTVYVFGSFSFRTSQNKTYSPLILKASPTEGNDVPVVPSINTAVVGLSQPDRDLYRMGAGIDIIGLIKKVAQGSSAKDSSDK